MNISRLEQRVLHVLAQFPTIQRVLVMVQREVADRLCAGPGSRTYGVPSVKARWFGNVHYAGDVGRNVFWPAPNVDSALVAMERREPPSTTASREDVFTVVDAAFAQRRKTLRATLAGLAGSGAAAAEALEAAGVVPSARGEVLPIVCDSPHSGTAYPEDFGHAVPMSLLRRKTAE